MSANRSVWHSLSPQEMAKKLKTDLERGLTAAESAARLVYQLFQTEFSGCSIEAGDVESGCAVEAGSFPCTQVRRGKDDALAFCQCLFDQFVTIDFFYQF